MNAPKILTFRPTYEEFQDFSRYIQYMESQGAHLAGIAKVIPPKEWIPKRSYDNIDSLVIPAPIEQVVSGHKGLFTQYNIQKKPITVKEFRRMNNTSRYEPPFHESYEELERIYWKNITFNAPIYGADISGSLYDKNVNVWNIARLETLLDVIENDSGVKIEGVNTAYLYFGMWKTTFAWHTEDMDLYSINYVHFGAPKSWYAVPPEHGKRLERLAAGFYPNDKSNCSAFLRHKMTLISPSILHQYGIPVNKITQEAGEFIITFPYGYHSGFNHGFNCAESTNFASERWVNYGKIAEKCTCKNDTVTINMDVFVRLFQPSQYEDWKLKKSETKVTYVELPLPPDLSKPFPTWRERATHLRKSLPDADQSDLAVLDLLSNSKSHCSTSQKRYKIARVQKTPHKEKKVKISPKKEVSSIESEKLLQNASSECSTISHDNVSLEFSSTMSNQSLFDRIKFGARRKSSAKAISCEADVGRLLHKHCITEPPIDTTEFICKIKKRKYCNDADLQSVKTSCCMVKCDNLCFFSHNIASKDQLGGKETNSSGKSDGKQQLCLESPFSPNKDESDGSSSNLIKVDNKTSFKEEREYNKNIAKLHPYCAVCSLFKPYYSSPQPDVKTCRGLPSFLPETSEPPEFVAGDSTKPLIPEVSFASSVNTPSPLAECKLLDKNGNSVLMQCCVCRVQVHGSCYGLEQLPDTPWTCNRCLERDWSAQCCLCCLRGGALKKLSGKVSWAHIVCAIAIPEVYFEDVIQRNHINISKIPPKRLKLKCVYGEKSKESKGVCVQCCTGKCITSFHTTCAHAAGISIEPGNWPFPVYVHCQKHTWMQTNNSVSSRRPYVSKTDVVVAKHKDGNYYRATVEEVLEQEFFKVNFRDNSWSDNLYAEDIINHAWESGNLPVIGSTVQVKWTDGNVYEAEYRGHSTHQLLKVVFHDGESVTVERKAAYSEEEKLPARIRKKFVINTDVQ
ncbi:unnamed protein product [Clavelina lepadiformis]|uniref:[histone H3]-trimethyl-L-lysine(9) demethylase n=1 Tax=Clavelina lepadiformis TaxID=159417 RepID=A0ABP0G148_CLALP